MSLTGHHMPPRTTQQSHRPRVSDRTMVGTLPPRCLQALPHGTKNAATDGPGYRATPRSTTEPHRGWMSDTYLLHLHAEGEKCFLLTSPFIEPPHNGAPFPRCKHRPVELFCVLLRTMRPDSPQWRTHDLAQQERQSRRAPIHFGLSGWRRAPPLHTHNLDRAWERDRDGKQYRGARVALSLGHCEPTARQRPLALRSVSSLSIA